MSRIKRLVGAAGVALAVAVYTWVVAVRAVPAVKGRKQARLAARAAAHR